MIRLAALAAAALAAGCAATATEMRAGPPGFTATLPGPTARATECLARQFEGFRLIPLGAPYSITSRTVDELGTLTVNIDPTTIGWVAETRPAGDRIAVTAWSQSLVHPDFRAVLADQMTTAVRQCGGAVSDNTFGLPEGRRMKPPGE